MNKILNFKAILSITDIQSRSTPGIWKSQTLKYTWPLCNTFVLKSLQNIVVFTQSITFIQYIIGLAYCVVTEGKEIEHLPIQK